MPSRVINKPKATPLPTAPISVNASMLAPAFDGTHLFAQIDAPHAYPFTPHDNSAVAVFPAVSLHLAQDNG